MEDAKTTRRCLMVTEFRATFDIQIDIIWVIFWNKIVKLHFLGSPQKSLKTCQHLHQYGHPLRNDGPFKKMKNLYFWWLLFQNEKC